MSKAIINLLSVVILFCIFSWQMNNIKNESSTNNEILQTQMAENIKELQDYMSETNLKIKNIEFSVTELQLKQDIICNTQNEIISEEAVEVKVQDNNKTLSKTDKWEINEELPLPSMPSNMKYCTDYRWYGIEGTPHNKMQNLSYTDEIGCRRYNNDYCVALGSFYSERIGDRFEITLESGNVFTVITGDMKADCDTDITNMYTPCVNYENEYCANIIEFIIDEEIISDDVYNYGSLDYHEEFKGDIVKIVYLGRDNSMAWDLYE